MKVNLHVPFVNIFGKEIKQDGKVQMMDETICSALFSGSFLRPGKTPEEESKLKMDAYLLCIKIMQAAGELELEIEEAAMVKQVAVTLNPGGYGQVYDLIEGGK